MKDVKFGLFIIEMTINIINGLLCEIKKVYTANKFGVGIIYDLETGTLIDKFKEIKDIHQIVPYTDNHWKVITNLGINIIKEEIKGNHIFNEITKILINIRKWHNIHVCGNYIMVLFNTLSTQYNSISVFSLIDGSILYNNIERYFCDNDYLFL
jgi:hypothetical protein